MATPRYDYFYNFPFGPLRVRGRCRVRIYERANNARTVLLTELDSNVGESITEACARIATNLATAKELNPKKTRWIQHMPPQGDELSVFDEVTFTWDGSNTASDPSWQRLDDSQVKALTGDTLEMLNGRLGELGNEKGKVAEHEPDEA